MIFDNLPNTGLLPRKIDTFLGLKDNIPTALGTPVFILANYKTEDAFRSSLIGNQGEVGLEGSAGPRGIKGLSAYIQEKDILKVSTLDAYVNKLNNFASDCSKYYNYFSTYWDTRIVSSKSSLSDQVTIPLIPNGVYDFVIDWGDSTSEYITEYKKLVHTYNKPGIYPINIAGVIEGFSFRDHSDSIKLLNINQWGNLTITTNTAVFANCTSLEITAKDVPTFKGVTRLDQFFANCTSLKYIPGIYLWPWHEIISIQSMTINCPSLLEDLSFLDNF